MRLTEIELVAQSSQITAALMEFFKHDRLKVILWLETPNPLLGNIAPLRLVEMGRGHKVLQFIEAALDENKLDE